MKLSCVIQVLLEIAFAFVINGDIVAVPQNTRAIFGTDVTLQCIVSRIGPTYEWHHGDVRIFGMDFEGTREREPGTEDEYEDFSLAASPAENFSLIISSVKIEYMGTYKCEQTGAGGSEYSAELKVEAPAVNISVTCNPSNSCPAPNEDPSVVTCTCTATGAYPNTLMLEWTGIEPPTTKPINVTSTSSGRNNSFDFAQEATGSISSSSGSITCTLTNYEIAEAERTATYEYSSPTCVLEVENEDACTSGFATLVCRCTDGSPNEISYRFFHGDFTEIQGDAQSNKRENISFTAEEETTFHCRGCNGFNFGEGSLGTATVCEKATTPTPVKTDEPPPTKVKGQGLETYAIILIVLACVGAAGGTGFAVYWFGFRTSDQESVKRSNNDNTDGNGVNSKLQSEPDQVEYAAVNKPKSDPQPAPRSSKPPGNNTEPEKMELQYADIDHSNRGRSNEIHQPADAPTEYATVQSVIV